MLPFATRFDHFMVTLARVLESAPPWSSGTPKFPNTLGSKPRSRKPKRSRRLQFMIRAPRLAELQKKLQAAIIAPEVSKRPRLPWVTPMPPLSPRERVDVYASAWFLRLEESLVDDYGAV